MNYMEQVAEMLGVKLGEVFDLTEGEEVLRGYRLTQDGLENTPDDCHVICPTMLAEILTGTAEIKRRPWTPKMREVYWYVYRPTGVEAEAWDLRYTTFNGCTDDLNHVAMGNCFSSKEAAEEAKNDVIARYEAILDTLKGKGE